MTADPLIELADVYAGIGRELAGHREPAGVLRALTELAVLRVPGAEFAGVTQALRGSYRTVAATHDLVERTDRIQYKLGSGPGIDALITRPVSRAGDLSTDDRWPEFGRRVAQSTGIHSVLSYRLFGEEQEVDHGASAGLNVYSTKLAAFDDDAESVGLRLAAFGTLAVLGAAARQRADHLQQALLSNRNIGVAMGILMALHKITRDRAFDLLCVYSQRTNRKIADLAAEIAETGELPYVVPTTGKKSLSTPPEV